tara:strand:+ start:130 stop:942 length:813 start_codon:yes stop_codon:yes gene_type:complete
MITGIVFSKDRPAQLHACIESIQKNAAGIFNINVLYTASNEYFQHGYDMLMDEPLGVRFIKESNFKKEMLGILDEFNDEKLLCFFTDDSIVYRPAGSLDDFSEVFDVSEMLCCSLRLGQNTVIQNPYKDTRSVIPSHSMSMKDKFLAWEWFRIPSSSNFGYPFSVDGHIYRKIDMIDIFRSYGYDTPNSFEGRFPVGSKLFPLMCCFEKSVLVNTPINIVGSSQNKSGENFGISLEDFNKQYLDGKRINIEKMDFENIIGCHQEIKMVME